MTDTTPASLNENAARLVGRLIEEADEMDVGIHEIGKARVVDCGIESLGSLQAGLALAEICMSGFGTSQLTNDNRIADYLCIKTETSAPLRATLYSQYAGWLLQIDDYFAMGSGPMRAAAGREPLFDELGGHERAPCVVGILESRALPPVSLINKIANDCQVTPEQISLLVAPTASIAGTIQIVARSVETALHKLHELKFDVTCIRQGLGTAPLPPQMMRGNDDDGLAMGQTNDAILYGAQVTLWCDCDDQALDEIVNRVPSIASSDYGRPFGELFKSYNYDFYQIDKLLFSPAAVTLISTHSNRRFSAGKVNEKVLRNSFGE